MLEFINVLEMTSGSIENLQNTPKNYMSKDSLLRSLPPCHVTPDSGPHLSESSLALPNSCISAHCKHLAQCWWIYAILENSGGFLNLVVFWNSLSAQCPTFLSWKQGYLIGWGKGGSHPRPLGAKGPRPNICSLTCITTPLTIDVQ
jgi:hypothetical protein